MKYKKNSFLCSLSHSFFYSIKGINPFFNKTNKNDGFVILRLSTIPLSLSLTFITDLSYHLRTLNYKTKKGQKWERNESISSFPFSHSTL